MHATPRVGAHPAKTVLLSVMLFFLLDGMLFRSGLYARFQQPNTPSGSMAAIIRFTSAAPTDPRRTVLVMGSSKTEYGFGARNVEEDFPNAPIQPVMGAFPGSNEEYWYYALERIDPHHNRYAAVVIPLPGYKIGPLNEGFSNSYSAAQMLIPVVPLSGLRAFLGDFSEPSLRWRAAVLALAPSHLYAADLEDFLLHPVARLNAVRSREAAGVNYLYIDPPHTDTMDGLAIDPRSRKVVKYPARFNVLFRDDMDQRFVAPLPEQALKQTARNAAFSAKWLGRIAESYKDSRTKLIFIDMPHQPVDLPAHQPVAGAPDIRDMLPKQANIFVLPADMFSGLQQPHYFIDLDHMNIYGKELFSRKLGQAIIDVVVHGTHPSHTLQQCEAEQRQGPGDNTNLTRKPGDSPDLQSRCMR